MSTPLVVGYCNNKGGTGKSTSAVNMAVLSCLHKKRTLLIDMDTQGCVTAGAGVDKWSIPTGILSLIMEGSKTSLKKGVLRSPFGMDVIGNNLECQQFVGALHAVVAERETLLRNKLSEVRDDYDLILIDAPPSLDVCTHNTIFASDLLVVPILLEPWAYQGMGRLVARLTRYNKHYRAFGVRARMDFVMSKKIIADCVEKFKDVFCKTTIPQSVDVIKLQWDGVPISTKVDHPVTVAYDQLGKELGMW